MAKPYHINAFHAEPTNARFLAKVKSKDQKLVAKFVDRYGMEAHQLLVDLWFAGRQKRSQERWESCSGRHQMR